jgi:hypothetical protein
MTSTPHQNFGNFWLTIQNTGNRHVSNAFDLLSVFISFPLARAAAEHEQSVGQRLLKDQDLCTNGSIYLSINMGASTSRLTPFLLLLKLVVSSRPTLGVKRKGCRVSTHLTKDPLDDLRVTKMSFPPFLLISSRVMLCRNVFKRPGPFDMGLARPCSNGIRSGAARRSAVAFARPMRLRLPPRGT